MDFELSQGQLKKEQERYEILKADANDKLSKANAQLAETQSSKEAEILKLRSMLKKAEVEVSSLERKADKIGRENEELTKICDELISKCQIVKVDYMLVALYIIYALHLIIYLWNRFQSVHWHCRNK